MDDPTHPLNTKNRDINAAKTTIAKMKSCNKTQHHRYGSFFAGSVETGARGERVVRDETAMSFGRELIGHNVHPQRTSEDNRYGLLQQGLTLRLENWLV